MTQVITFATLGQADPVRSIPKRYKVNHNEIDMHRVKGSIQDNFDFSGRKIDVDLSAIGYIAGKHITKASFLNKNHFKYIHEVGTYPHIRKNESVRVIIGKQTAKGRKTVLICKG